MAPPTGFSPMFLKQPGDKSSMSEDEVLQWVQENKGPLEEWKMALLDNKQKRSVLLSEPLLGADKTEWTERTDLIIDMAGTLGQSRRSMELTTLDAVMICAHTIQRIETQHKGYGSYAKVPKGHKTRRTLCCYLLLDAINDFQQHASGFFARLLGVPSPPMHHNPAPRIQNTPASQDNRAPVSKKRKPASQQPTEQETAMAEEDVPHTHAKRGRKAAPESQADAAKDPRGQREKGVAAKAGDKKSRKHVQSTRKPVSPQDDDAQSYWRQQAEHEAAMADEEASRKRKTRKRKADSDSGSDFEPDTVVSESDTELEITAKARKVSRPPAKKSRPTIRKRTGLETAGSGSDYETDRKRKKASKGAPEPAPEKSQPARNKRVEAENRKSAARASKVPHKAGEQSYKAAQAFEESSDYNAGDFRAAQNLLDLDHQAAGSKHMSEVATDPGSSLEREEGATKTGRAHGPPPATRTQLSRGEGADAEPVPPQKSLESQINSREISRMDIASHHDPKSIESSGTDKDDIPAEEPRHASGHGDAAAKVWECNREAFIRQVQEADARALIAEAKLEKAQKVEKQLKEQLEEVGSELQATRNAVNEMKKLLDLPK